MNSSSPLEDCAAASAAYVLNCVIPTLDKLPAPEQFEKLKDAFTSCLAAYIEFRGETVPSLN